MATELDTTPSYKFSIPTYDSQLRRFIIRHESTHAAILQKIEEKIRTDKVFRERLKKIRRPPPREKNTFDKCVGCNFASCPFADNVRIIGE